jgi:hypothetical protein
MTDFLQVNCSKQCYGILEKYNESLKNVVQISKSESPMLLPSIEFLCIYICLQYLDSNEEQNLTPGINIAFELVLWKH